jgi:radical SAM superfamily enzyme YgiQ (UPF0313 family)
VTSLSRPECVVIGHNEPPFERYEAWVRRYGRHSEAYRDLKLNFVEVAGRKLNYVELMNHVYARSRGVDDRALERPLRSGDIPCLAAVYLTHFLRKRQVRAEFINLFQDEQDRLSRLLDENPLAVAITTTLYTMNDPANEIVRFVRQRNPATRIVVGGPLIATHARHFSRRDQAVAVSSGRGATLGSAPAGWDDAFVSALDDIGADIYVVESQGELTLWRIVCALRNGSGLADIPNIIYRENGSYCATPAVAEDNPLDDNVIDWRALPDYDLGPTIQTRTARSCAFNCAFCNYPTRTGRLSLASVAAVEHELDSLRELGSVKSVVFIDDTFNVPLERFKEICRLMLRKQYGFRWFSYFRCSNSDDEAIELMAQSGCTGVFLGIESGSPSILRNMNKAATVDKYERGIERLRRHGILTFASFIVGFPGETAQTLDETQSFIERTAPDYYRAQLWYDETGTPIESQRAKYGISGQGFVWTHETMESLEAMDHVDRIFLSTRDSLWLPQWSYDFWIVPYLLDRGLSLSQLRAFMTVANELLRAEIAYVPPEQKVRNAAQRLDQLIDLARGWPAVA